MNNESFRVDTRYPMGSTAMFQNNGGYFSGGVLNSSLGGIFFEPINCSPVVSEGEELTVTLEDIFSENLCSFKARVMRKSIKGIAFQFTRPLNNSQKSFLLNWFTLVTDFDKDVGQ
ncbi:MAG: PilZ domain-containing protein [Nitrospinota bacterium]